jgi:hypothetical protein
MIILHFKCSAPDAVRWSARFVSSLMQGTCGELLINSRATSLRVILGESSLDLFAGIPILILADFRDVFWNADRLVAALGEVDKLMWLAVIADSISL